MCASNIWTTTSGTPLNPIYLQLGSSKNCSVPN
jgi:hypothetical protein